MPELQNIFLSYAHEDRNFADSVARLLNDRGFNVWSDEHLPNGQYFREVIHKKLDEAAAVLVCWTPTSKESRFVLDEADQALSLGKLVMLRHQDLAASELPLGFRNVQSHTLDKFDQIVTSLQTLASPFNTEGDDVEVAAKCSLSTVFSTARPTVTLVNRSKTAEYKLLRLELMHSGRLVHLHGPSKSGKTTLALEILRSRNPIIIHATDFQSSSEFYTRELARHLGLSEGAAGGVLAERCATTNRPVMIDDFHIVAPETQVGILEGLKGFLDRGVTFVVLSIPDRLKSIEQSHEQIFCRSVSLPAPRWTSQAIRAIGVKGFAALNIHIDPSTLSILALNSFGNPLLMQEHCGQACARQGIFESQRNRVPLSMTLGQLAPIFESAAKRVGKVYGGVACRKGDTKVRLRSGSEATLYEIALLAISQLGVAQPIGMPNLLRRMRTYVAGALPITKPEELRSVVGELAERSSQLTNSADTIALINDSLYILHPYFKIFLVWDLLPRLGGSPETLP